MGERVRDGDGLRAWGTRLRGGGAGGRVGRCLGGVRLRSRDRDREGCWVGVSEGWVRWGEEEMGRRRGGFRGEGGARCESVSLYGGGLEL